MLASDIYTLASFLFTCPWAKAFGAFKICRANITSWLLNTGSDPLNKQTKPAANLVKEKKRARSQEGNCREKRKKEKKKGPFLSKKKKVRTQRRLSKSEGAS